MAHDGGVERGAQSPHGLVEKNGGGKADIPPEHVPAGPQKTAELEPKALAEADMPCCDHKLQDAGEEGGQGGALYPHGGGSQLAENKDPVQQCVAQHGTAQDVKPQHGICHGAVGGDIDLGQGVKQKGEGHDPGILSGQSDHIGVVSKQGHEGLGEEKHDAPKA